MHGDRVTHVQDPGPARVPQALSLGLLVAGVIGLLGFVAGFFTGGEEHRQLLWSGFLISYLFFYFLAMGAAAFLAINYVVGAKWYIVLKRPLEAVASFAVYGGFLFPLIALAGTGSLYPWALEGRSYPYDGTMKAAYLTPTAHVIKVIIYVALLTVITYLLLKNSTDADRKPDPRFRARQLRMSIIFLIIFAPAFSLFSLDVIKSLSPKWFSTMFGVYCFAGALVSALALCMLMSFWLRKRTPMVRERQMYDMGTYVMAFSTFMIYIGFSQFMLIWYANIPDETAYYLARYEGGWLALTIALPILKWVIPFFVLMPPPLRTNVPAQVFVCCSILVGQFLDIYWMVAPTFPFEGPREAYGFGLFNILTFIGVLGVFGWSTVSYLGRHSLLPVGDPDLANSINGDYLHA